MRQFNNLSITILCTAFLIACSSPPGSTGQPVETAAQMTPPEVVQVSPNTEMPATGLASPLTPSVEMPATEIALTLTPTVVDISTCAQATIIFTAKASTEEGAIRDLYSICADGTDLRKILSSHEVDYGDFDISPDGHSLALSNSPRDSIAVSSTLSIVNLDSLLFSELITKEQARFGPRWSANGQYLGYLVFGSVPSETQPETYIEIVHLESGTVSDIHLTDRLNDFDWSSDNNRVVFGAWVPPDEYSLDEYMVFMGEISCDDVTKKCQLTQITRIPDVGQYPSWIPNTQTLVSVAMRFSDTGNRQTLLLTNVQNGTVQEIDPGALDPKAANVSFPQGSADGRYIGFIGSGGALYVIDVDRMSMQNITLGNEEHIFQVIRFEWLDSDSQ